MAGIVLYGHDGIDVLFKEAEDEALVMVISAL